MSSTSSRKDSDQGGRTHRPMRTSVDVGAAPNRPSKLITSRHDITPGWQCFIATPSNGSKESHVSHTTPSASQSSTSPAAELDLSSILTSAEELRHIEVACPLPPKPNSIIFRNLRWNILQAYERMFLVVLALNLTAIIVFLDQLLRQSGIATYNNAATGAAANFCVAVLVRNEHVINALFRVACSLPVWTPLFLRRRVAKIYSYGGLHSACGISGSAWYIVFAVLSIKHFEGPHQTGLAVTTGVTVVLLGTILVFAYPGVRARLHNQFEATHRFGGWAAIIMLWVQAMFLVAHAAQTQSTAFGIALVKSPPFWFLVIITALTIYPWTRVRCRQVQVEPLSTHATRLRFDYADMDACLAVRLTDSPLFETHAFATIPNYPDEEKGFSVLVSNAGDWTNRLINNPPSRLYIKGAPTIGVMRVALMFKKVLMVATGSGIGPGLSMLQAYPEYPMRVLWSAPSPDILFGHSIIKSVFRADPDAVIIDTKKSGRPNLLALSYSLFTMSECEAVFVISNPPVTKQLVYGLEARGIPAYGPIFDS